MNKNNIITRSFNLVMIPMSFFGLYPPDEPSTFFKVRSCVFYVIFMVLLVILATANLLFKKYSTFMEVNNMLFFVTENGFLTLKTLPFMLYRRRIKKCINYFGHPRFAPKDDEEERIIEDCVRVCRNTCKIFFSLLVAVTILWIFPSLFFKKKKLPVDIWLPYDPYSSPLIFYPTFIFFSLASIYDGICGTLTDPMIGTLPYHATSQLKILKHNIRTFYKFVEDATDQNGNSVITFEKASKILRQCIQHHNDILMFVNEYENSFSWFIFCQVSGATISLCFCCYGIAMSPCSSINALKSLAIYFFVISQIFFYCFFGTLLYEENNGFVDAICDGPWYRYDPKIRKVLITMMERSKKPLIVTAGKMFELTLQTFTWILRTSYSLFAVLKENQ